MCVSNNIGQMVLLLLLVWCFAGGDAIKVLLAFT